MTHEIGHYLNLLHIWGDDGRVYRVRPGRRHPEPGRRDLLAPAFPAISCSNGPNGDMFMNYMDYTDDDG